jgi:nucleoside-diphosphate-sugar epimerase|tara:strand:+ start:507 stop:1397 length:891 start_codon:yes stop_codon:yes gene_type:complete
MILLTGASGFIGKHLLRNLVGTIKEEKVVALTSEPLNDCEYLPHNNYSFNSDYFIDNNLEDITTLVHAGAYTPKSQKNADDISGSYSNVRSTTKLLMSRLPSLRKIIFLSAVDVYGEDDVITEATNTYPVSLYGSSKLYCEKMISTHAENENLVCQILRIGHVYGPGEDAYQKVIPIMLQRVIEGGSLQLHGDGQEIRSFIFISDVVDAIVKSISLNESVGPVNIVSTEQIKIIDLIKLISGLSDKDIAIEKVKRETRQRNLVYDNTKMLRYTTAPQVNLKEGLKQELDYFSKLLK